MGKRKRAQNYPQKGDIISRAINNLEKLSKDKEVDKILYINISKIRGGVVAVFMTKYGEIKMARIAKRKLETGKLNGQYNFLYQVSRGYVGENTLRLLSHVPEQLYKNRAWANMCIEKEYINLDEIIEYIRSKEYEIERRSLYARDFIANLMYEYVGNVIRTGDKPDISSTYVRVTRMKEKGTIVTGLVVDNRGNYGVLYKNGTDGFSSELLLGYRSKVDIGGVDIAYANIDETVKVISRINGNYVINRRKTDALRYLRGRDEVEDYAVGNIIIDYDNFDIRGIEKQINEVSARVDD